MELLGHCLNGRHGFILVDTVSVNKIEKRLEVEMQPLVSVIIPCFNCAKYLQEAVESVLSQTFADLECLIVDDGSTDNSRQISEEFMKRDPRVKYYLKEHAGVDAARNFGIKHARGEWIQHLDADDYLHRNKIKFQLERFSGFGPEDEVVFYSDYEVIWEDRDQNIVKRATNIVGDATNRQLLGRLMAWSFQANTPLHSNNTLFRKKIFDNRTYREDWMAFGEELLFVDLLLSNVSFIYTPIVGMSYRLHQSNTTRDRRAIRFAYIDYLEAVYEKDKRLLQLCPNMAKLIKEATARRDKEMFDRIIALVSQSQAPVYLLNGKINVNKPWILKMVYYWNVNFSKFTKRAWLSRAKNKIVAKIMGY